MKRSLVELDKQILALKKRKEKIQEKCEHKNASKTHRGDTGNFDPSSDEFWTEFNCEDCGKFWIQKQ